MAEERTTGLILRTRPLTETSLIVHWLTPDLGRIATVAKGARRPTSPFRGKLDLFFLAHFTFVRSRRSELHNLREAGLLEANSKLRGDLAYLQQASYFVSLVEQSTETETPLPEVFTLMVEALAELPKRPAKPLTVFAFEIKLLAELGLMPDLESSSLNLGTRQIASRCLELDWGALNNVKLSGTQTSEVQQFLQDFLLSHLGKLPAGRTSAVGAA
jgi:DNA repair protein RecO (recombination protein O)